MLSENKNKNIRAFVFVNSNLPKIISLFTYSHMLLDLNSKYVS